MAGVHPGRPGQLNLLNGGPLHNSYGRDHSATRGRNPTLATTPGSLSIQPQSLSARALSPRIGNGGGEFPSRPSTANTERERRGSGSYGHNRQTSIIQGVQHSRNNSQANSPGFNRSPQISSPEQNGINVRTMYSYGVSIGQQHAGYDSVSSTASGADTHFLSNTSTVVPATGTHAGGAFAHNGSREHKHSHSGKSDQKSVADYSLHHLFNSFVGRAEHKMAKCAKVIPEGFKRVEDVCGPGVDLDFDALISAMGHMNREKPKSLVDTIMFWRKSKSEALHKAQQSLIAFKNGDPNIQALSRRGTDQSTNERGMPQDVGGLHDQKPIVTEARLVEEIQKEEHKLALAIYLIMRVLIEVYQQSNMEWIGDSLDRKLQDLIFDQLSRLAPDEVYTSPFSHANWNIYGQVLGVMSTVHFSGVSARFIQRLQRLQEEVDRSSVPKESREGREATARLELLVKAFTYVHIGTKTELQWRESCDFMFNLAQIFLNSHGQPLKHAYCQALELLVFPIAAASTPHLLAAPGWKDFTNALSSRLIPMINKPRHWHEASPLNTLLLCASSSELFLHQWQSAFSVLTPKLKEKATRALALQSIARLVWTYLDRNRDRTVTLRKLEEIIKVVLSSSKKQAISAEPAFADPMIELARIIGFRFPEFCCKAMIFPLLNFDLFNSGKDIKVEQLEPDRIVVGIRSFLAVVDDIENRERGAPTFPTFDLQHRRSDPLDLDVPHSPQPTGPQRSTVGQHDEKFARKVVTSKLDPITREYYAKFCEVLGRITQICDNTFGGQATLEERLGGSTPKTPISEGFSFGRRDEPLTQEVKQSYYELLHVSVQALPRCFSNDIPLKPLVSLLCTGTAHSQQHIATSAATSLKAIARQSQAQAVASGFAKFLFNLDGRHSITSEDGLLGPGHFQRTLQLYVDLLNIWLDEIKQRTKSAGTAGSPSETPQSARGPGLDLTHQTALVEQTLEPHGLFFLCSSSRQIRSYGVLILKLVTEFDAALGHQGRRIIHILEGEIYQVIQPDDDRLDVAERSRLEKGKGKKGPQITLVELCKGNDSYDSTLWFKVFPNVMRLSFDQCQMTVTIALEIISHRFFQMHYVIFNLVEPTKSQQPGAPDRSQARVATPAQESCIEQWRLYLIMVCTTLTNTGAQTQSQLQHVRTKSSKSPGRPERGDRTPSARSLFSYIIPLLGSSINSIRDAIVIALASINTSFYRTLLESLQYAVTSCNEAVRARANAHQRTGSAPRSDPSIDRLRTEVTHIYKLTSRFLRSDEVLQDEWIVRNLVTYNNSMRRFLSDAEIQNDCDCQTLRKHYCGLMEEVFEAINRTSDPSKYLSFDDRLGAFGLMEDWCGFSPNQNQIALREESMKQAALNHHNDMSERVIEVQKKELRTAALSAMAALCSGPYLHAVFDGRLVQNMSFDVTRIMAWIDLVFGTDVDKPHQIGRRALKNFIVYNKSYPKLLEHAIDMCFNLGRPKALESYFEVVSAVLTEHEDYPLPLWRVIVAMLFNLGNEKGAIRLKSARLLRTLEQRLQKNSKIQDFDISVSDKTTAVYKNAQFKISERLAKSHSDQAFYVFSQFALHYKGVPLHNQRNMIVSILPWVRALELQLGSNGSPTAQTYMVLANLLEITTRSSNALHNEIQALWQALATGPHGGNVQVSLDFVISLCMDRREQSFVDYVKQIVVFLSSTLAGEKVVEYLLLQITPKNMVHTEKKPMEIPPDVLGLPYIADLGEALPIGNKQSGFSLGQLSLILLVDLMVSPLKLSSDHVPLLLQVCLVYWDHYTPLVQEEAREMLVHLIHELVISKIDDDNTTPRKSEIEDFVEAIRESKPAISWIYAERDSKDHQIGTQVPTAMTYVTSQLIDVFSITYPNIHASWAKTTLNWATSCSVRHVACRSFQIFRCMLQSLDKIMLSDMLARLSNTIADEAPEVQSFSMEILATLRAIVGALDGANLLKFPQLFWVTCACLNTVNEREFIETLELLDVLLAKVDLSDPAVVKLLSEAQPDKWEGTFEGIMPLVYKGLKSGNSLAKTVSIINKTANLPNSNLIGDERRLLFGILANLPGYLCVFDPKETEKTDLESADLLASAAEAGEQHDLSRILSEFHQGRYVSKEAFLSALLKAIEQAFFPRAELNSLIFLIGLLTNRLPWLIFNVIDILLPIIPKINMRSPDVVSLGPDLISPLLRLLQTQYCNEALKVMDQITSLSPTPDDKHYMRMSMVSAESKNMRKEFDRTKSLYGIPEVTGWSVPMPAINSNITRANVHAVFYTCASSAAEQAQTTETPEIEFASEEFHSGSYFPTTIDDTSHLDRNTGDIVSKLNSLDDFFEDDDEDMGESSNNKYLSGYSDVTITGYSPEIDRAGGNLYDQQTAPILENSLARQPSTSSLHNPYTDSRPSTAIQNYYNNRPAPTSNPYANGNGHYASTTDFSAAQQQQRPGLHSRSVTSPSNPTPNNHPTTTPEVIPEPDSMDDNVFSDDERSTAGYASSGSLLEGIVRRARSTAAKRTHTGITGSDGKEYGQRELLRGQKPRLRSKSQAPGSPEVPKVPEAFLNLGSH